MEKYKVFTDKGSWTIEANDDFDAMRKALYFCWRDSENFRRMESVKFHYTLQISIIENNQFYTIP